MMMAPTSSSCFLPNEPASSSQSMLGYGLMTSTGGHEDVESGNPVGLNHFSTSLLCSISILKERVRQAQSLVSLFASPSITDQHYSQQVVEPEPASMTMARISSLVQDVVAVSTSMMLTCQQMSLSNPTRQHFQASSGHHHPWPISGHRHNQTLIQDGDRNNHVIIQAGQDVGRHQAAHKQEEILGHHDMFGIGSSEQDMEWFGGSSSSFANATLSYDTATTSTTNSIQQESNNNTEHHQLSQHPDLIIEMDAADLLAKYTHFCRVCGKGFKRDANLRMHMRAHGDEYKSIAALANPAKIKADDPNIPAKTPSTADKTATRSIRYSCPHHGCKWNRKHPKFQPLKSMICAKNHYKRSHCPKMYACDKIVNKAPLSCIDEHQIANTEGGAEIFIAQPDAESKKKEEEGKGFRAKRRRFQQGALCSSLQNGNVLSSGKNNFTERRRFEALERTLPFFC